jgi:hypothetical protein
MNPKFTPGMLLNCIIYTALLCSLACTPWQKAESQHKKKPNAIKIKEEQLILLDPNKQEKPWHSFDEDLSTAWFPGWKDDYYPAKLFIDLEGKYNLTGIDYHDGKGSFRITIKAGEHAEETKMKLLADINTDKFNVWESLNFESVSARYILITIHTPKGKAPDELVFYGQLVERYVSDAKEIELKYPKFQDVMGINSFPWVNDTLMLPFSSSREYLYWEWMESKQGVNEFSPSRNADFQVTFRSRLDNNIVPIPCVINSPKWIQNAPEGKNKPAFRPKLYEFPANVPVSYKAFARFWYQFAARFGNTHVSPDKQTINTKPFWANAKPNPLISGEGLVKYVEIWNEPNQWWNGPLAKFSPFEYAAMLSACYDGHESTLGSNMGAKNADSTIKVVFGGLAGLNVDYFRSADLWSKMYRKDQKLPADVLNVHHYCNNKGEQKVANAHALPPEECDFLPLLRKTAKDLKRYFPGKELWLSEYGYDTNKSTQSVSAIGSMGVETVQAAWIMRSLLQISASGFDKAHLYAICDFPGGEDAIYMASGVLGQSKEGYPKKEAWFYLMQLRQTLNDYTFVAEKMSDDQVWQFDYKKDNQTIKMVWSATSTDRKLPKYKITIPANVTQVKVRTFNAGRTPDDIILPVSDGSIIIEVSEIPKAVMF